MRKIFFVFLFTAAALAQPELSEQFKLLKSTNVNDRRNAVRDLGRMRTPEAAQKLMEILGKDSDFGVRAQAAESLGSMRSKEATPALIKALKDENRNVKSAALVTFGYIRDKDSVGPLLEFAEKEEDVGLKIQAVNVLGVIGDATAVPALVKLLDDKNGRIATISAQSLGRLRSPDSVKPLLSKIESEDAALRQYSIRALGEIGDKSALPDLEKRLEKEKDPAVKLEMANTLGNLGSAAGYDVALLAASSDDIRTKKQGMRALGVIKKLTPEVEKIILDAWASDDARIKSEAQMAAEYLSIKLPVPEKKKEEPAVKESVPTGKPPVKKKALEKKKTAK